MTSYRDESVQPGTRYVYAVVAVDRAVPQNVSPQSNRVEETAQAMMQWPIGNAQLQLLM